MFRATGDARVDTMPPLHVFVVIRPIGKVMLAFVTRVRTFTGVLSPVRRKDALEPETFTAKLARIRHCTGVYPMVFF